MCFFDCVHQMAQESTSVGGKRRRKDDHEKQSAKQAKVQNTLIGQLFRLGGVVDDEERSNLVDFLLDQKILLYEDELFSDSLRCPNESETETLAAKIFYCLTEIVFPMPPQVARIIQVLFAAGLTFGSWLPNQDTLLGHMCWSNPEVTLFLLTSYPTMSVDVRCRRGYSPLDRAVILSNTPLVNELMKRCNEATLNWSPKNDDPLIFRAIRKLIVYASDHQVQAQYRMINKLIDAAADDGTGLNLFSSRDEYGRTPLEYATFHNGNQDGRFDAVIMALEVAHARIQKYRANCIPSIILALHGQQLVCIMPLIRLVGAYIMPDRL